jgi:ABC-type multidrug transport system fused ATPase/permease subunit
MQAYFLFGISPSIAALAGVLVPLFYLATKVIGCRLRPLSSEWVRSHAEMFATLAESSHSSTSAVRCWLSVP